MTIEEKAKAYDEAIKEAEAAHKDEDKHLRATLERIFPVLAETEDEKKLRKLHSWMKEFGGAEEYTEEVYQWLKDLIMKQKPTEKQTLVGYPKPIFQVDDVMRTKEEAEKGWVDGMPVVVSVDSEYYHCNNELIAIKDQGNYEYPPINRKPKWGEEDKRCLNEAIEVLERYDYCGCADNLKNIRSRFYWKPTGEQMEALQHALDAVENEWVYTDNDLRSLVEDLKKL